MRKIIIILSGIFMIFCFLYLNDKMRENFIQSEITNDYLGENLQFMIFDNKVKSKNEKLESINMLDELANEYQVTLVKNIKSNDIMINQFMHIENEEAFNRYKIDSKFNESVEAVISTDRSLATMGEILTYDGDINIVKKPFLNEENNRIDGWYYVYGERKTEFYNVLQYFIPYKMEIIDNSPENHGRENGYNLDAFDIRMFKFGMVFIGSSIIILLIYFSNKSHDISIKKLHGFSTVKIMKEDLFKLTLVMLCIDIFISIIMYTLFVHKINCLHIPLLINLFKSLLFKYLSLFIVYLIVLVYVSGISISNLIKKRNISKYIMHVNVALRIVFIFVLSITISDMLPEFNETIKMAFGYDKFIEECGDYAHGITINGFLEIEQEEKILYYLKQLQQKNTNYIGVSTSNYNNDIVMEYKYLDVNYNYLEKYPILDANGNVVKNLNQDIVYLLVPKSIKDDYYTYHATIDVMREFLDFEEIIIEDNQKVFTFDIMYNEGGLGFIKHTPILVSNDFSWYNLYFDNDGFNDFTNANKLFDAFDVSYNYDYVKDEAAFVYNMKMSNVLSEGTVILLYITLLVLLIVQHLLFLFDLNSKEFMIKKLNGYSFFDRYIDVFLLLFITYLVNFVIMKYQNLSLFSFVVLLSVMLADIGVTSLIIIFMEKESMNSILKGG